MLPIAVRNIRSWRLINHYMLNIWSNGGCHFFCIKNKLDTLYLQDKFVNFFRSNIRYKLYTFNYDQNDTKPFKLHERGANMLEKKAMESMSVSELLYFMYSFNDKKDIQHNISKDIVLRADKMCCKELDNMNRLHIYKCLDAWYSFCQGNIVSKYFYLQFVNIAEKWLHSERNPMEELVYIMFYASMLKNTPLSQKIIRICLMQLENNICQLTLDELCIVINSSFKASVKIKSKKFLRYVTKVTIDNLEYLVNNPGYIVTIMKGLRLAKFYDFKLMDEMADQKYSCNFINMNLISKIHILALYADSLYSKVPLVPSVIQSCMQDFSLISDTVSVVRLKDVSRFLWAVCYLNYKISSEDLRIIVDHLQILMNRGSKRNAEHIVSCLLSLWIMGNKTTVLFNAVVIDELMKSLKERNVFRSMSRLSLLLTCIQIEMPEILSNGHINWKINNIIPPKAVEKHLKEREFLQTIHTAVLNLSQQMNIHLIHGCFLPNLNIIGITVQSSAGKIMHIEVLDKTVCLHNTCKPNGIMRLKLDLLKQLRHRVLVIPDDAFDTKRDCIDMYVFLEEELNKLLQTS